ncbi:MAG: hypothetical protein V4612_06905 [Pseudomonadota bacterium]
MGKKVNRISKDAIAMPDQTLMRNNDGFISWVFQCNQEFLPKLNQATDPQIILKALYNHSKGMNLFLGRFQFSDKIDSNAKNNLVDLMPENLSSYFASLEKGLEKNELPEVLDPQILNCLMLMASVIQESGEIMEKFDNKFFKKFVNKLATKIQEQDLSEAEKQILCVILGFFNVDPNIFFEAAALGIDGDGLEAIAKRFDDLIRYQYECVFFVEVLPALNTQDMILNLDANKQSFRDAAQILRYLASDQINLKDILPIANRVVLIKNLNTRFKQKIAQELKQALKTEPFDPDLLQILMEQVGAEDRYLLKEILFANFANKDLEKLKKLALEDQSQFAELIEEIITDRKLLPKFRIMEQRINLAKMIQNLQIIRIQSKGLMDEEIERIAQNIQDTRESINALKATGLNFAAEIEKARQEELLEQDLQQSFGVETTDASPAESEILALQSSASEVLTLESSSSEISTSDSKPATPDGLVMRVAEFSAPSENHHQNKQLITESKEQIEKLAQALRENRTYISQSNTMMDNLQGLLRKLQSENEVLNEDIQELRQKNADNCTKLNAENQKLKLEIEKITTQIKTLQAQKLDAEKKLTEEKKSFDKNLQQESRKSNIIQTQNESLQENLADLNSQLQLKEASLADLQAQVVEQETKILEERQRLQESNLRLQKAEDESVQAKKDSTAFSLSWDRGNKKNDELLGELARLRENCEALSNQNAQLHHHLGELQSAPPVVVVPMPVAYRIEIPRAISIPRPDARRASATRRFPGARPNPRTQEDQPRG